MRLEIRSGQRQPPDKETSPAADAAAAVAATCRTDLGNQFEFVRVGRDEQAKRIWLPMKIPIRGIALWRILELATGEKILFPPGCFRRTHINWVAVARNVVTPPKQRRVAAP